MEGRAVLLAPVADGGPGYVFRQGAGECGEWSSTDSSGYRLQRGPEGHWWILDAAGEEIGAPEAPPEGRRSKRSQQLLPCREEPSADVGALQRDKVKAISRDRREVYKLILAAAREREAQAAAGAADVSGADSEDALDGDLPPRGRWTIRNSLYKLARYELSVEEEELLALECQYQASLRPLDDMLAHLQGVVGPPGGLIVDLGCGAGAVAQLFAQQSGVEALGIDSDARMVAAAKARSPNLSFRCADVGKLHLMQDLQGSASGVWCSFVAAHFTGKQLEKAIAQWAWMLRPGGWLCVVDLEGLYSVHRPYTETRWARDFRQLDDDLQNVMKYDPFVGKRLAQACKRAGLRLLDEREWPGATEFNFEGPASEDQASAWAVRMESEPTRSVFRKYFQDFDKAAKAAFIDCLASEEHATRCRVRMVICSKAEA